jgi:2-(1,2-epoxy-1,2-dihydrophenyl)acetyl-CoA isomerase
MSDTLLYSVAGGVASFTLNQPHVTNALDPATIGRLRDACVQACDDATVRCIVLRGNGPAFFAGAVRRQILRPVNQTIAALRRAAKPVLASVHGAVTGVGMSLLAAADLAIAANDTQFTLAYSKIGASPDAGCSWTLPRLVGSRKALELMLLSDSFDADKALALGLLNWVTSSADLATETDKIAQRLAYGPTFAFGQTKALINRSFERPLESQLDAEVHSLALCAGTADLAEGMSAFVEKRNPVFTGR